MPPSVCLRARTQVRAGGQAHLQVLEHLRFSEERSREAERRAGRAGLLLQLLEHSSPCDALLLVRLPTARGLAAC